MNKINDGGPAFPAAWANDSDLNAIAPNGQVCPPFSSIPLPGMSLRDYFAAKALQGLLADPSTNTAINSTDRDFIERERQKFADLTARAAYRMADAMLRARGEA